MFISKHNKQQSIMQEKRILSQLKEHPGLIGLHYTFQDHENLYFVLTYASYGELFIDIQRANYYTFEVAQLCC